MDQERADGLVMRAVALQADVVGAPQAGRIAARAVLEEARRARHVEATVLALRALGHACRLLGEYEEATRSLDAAARSARSHRRDDLLVEVLITRAGLRLERGRVRDASRDLARARIHAGTPNAEVEFLQGRFEEEAGRLRNAAASYRRALDLAADAPPELRLKILNELAVFEGLFGRREEAEELLVEALSIATKIGSAAEGFITHNLGWVALQGSHLVDALRWFDAAEEQLAAGGFPLTEHELDQMEAFLTMRLASEGLALAGRVVASLRATGNQLALAQALLKQAHLFLLADRPADAALSADGASALFRRQRRTAWAARAASTAAEARLAAGTAARADPARCEGAASVLDEAGYVQEAADVRLVLARIALAAGDDERAAAALDRITTVTGGSVQQRLRGWLAAALLARQRGDYNAVAHAAERGLRELEAYRATLGSTELRALASGHGQELASMGLAAALASGRAPRLFAWLERGRVQSLLTPTPPRSDADLTTALAELRLFRQRLDTDGEPSDQRGAAHARVEARVRRLARLTAGAGVGLARPVDLRQVRAVLADRTLLEFGIHDGSLVAVSVSARGVRRSVLGPLAAVQDELAYLLAALRRLGLAGPSETATARATEAAHAALAGLDDLLVGPLCRQLADAPAIVVSPPAILMAVPWGSLPSLADRPVTVAPAAGLWLTAEARASSRPRRGPVFLAAGPRLTSAPGEVAALARLYPAPTVLTPPDSTVACVLTALDGAAVAHLACHATFRRDNPMFSSLELTDGPLVVHDVERLSRPPAVLVLAACDSGLSETYPGEELVGFLSVLLAAGTDSMIASVVPIPDVDTVPLMTALHTRMVAGARPAAALAHARADLAGGSPAAFLAATAFSCFGSG